MQDRADRVGDWDDELLAVAEPVRALVAARLADRHGVDDVVQETLARLLAARGRLDGSSLLPYALVTARNLVAEQGRELGRQRRLAHRVIDLREQERPDELVVEGEEQAALAAALRRLPEPDRRLLIEHEVHDRDTRSLAAAAETTPGGVAAQLSRARARLRVNYLLALRRVELPTPRCHPVLLALSAGDRRRQRLLQAGRHLVACRSCAELSQPLLERRRGLAGWLPWLGFPALVTVIRRAFRHRGVQAGTVVAAAAVLAGIVVSATGRPVAPARQVSPVQPTAAPTRPVEPAAVTVSGRPLRLASATAALTAYVGQPVRGLRVLVLAVPADEGFWVGTGPRDRIWVQLRTKGESEATIRVGQRVSFTGVMVAAPPGFAARIGLTPVEGAAALAARAAYVSVPESALRIG